MRIIRLVVVSELSTSTSYTKYRPLNKNIRNAKQIGTSLTTFVLIYEYIETTNIIIEKPESPMAKAISIDCIKIHSKFE